MISALFTYTRMEKVNGKEVANDNYINPLHVISMYWAVTDSGARVLNIFTSAVVESGQGSKTMRVTFGEKTGLRFVEHVESFLALMLQVQTNQAQPHEREREAKRSGPRSYGTVIDPDAALEIQSDSPVWESQPSA